MKNCKATLESALAKRSSESRLRTLPAQNSLIDFCSNDYLGMARSAELRTAIEERIAELKPLAGASGSRLISGNSAQFEELESALAASHKQDSALIFSSGYAANLGLLSSVPRRCDTIFYDQYVHASIRDGITLSPATAYSFRHNDLSDLETKLSHARGNCYVVVESLYSMDGDLAPLKELVALAEKRELALIVDEAHSNGVYGEHGEGILPLLGIQDKVFAAVYTFGKALGVHGACVVGSRSLREYLINFSRPFIYTTALSPHSLIAIEEGYRQVRIASGARAKLHELITLFKRETVDFGYGVGAIQSVLIPGNDRVKEISLEIEQHGFDVRPILSPTVPDGKERLRICLHSFNTEEQVETLCRLISELLNKI